MRIGILGRAGGRHILDAVPASPVPLLEVRRVSKRFPGVVALDAVTLGVRQGEVHVVLGENGAGKSTLMRILSGAESMDAGEIRLDGRPVSIGSPGRARALGIRTIHQELQLVPHLSVGENVFLGQLPHGRIGWVDWRRIAAESARMLADLGLAIDPRTPVRALGLAERQMVEIVKALSGDARLLIMDEPTSALTAAEVHRLFDTVALLTARGVGVLYISHRMEELFRIGHRVTVLRDGRAVATLDVAATSVDALVRLMSDRIVRDDRPRRQVVRGAEVLRVEHVTRRGVLRDVSLTLHRGEVLGIAGLVGAGRTELARAMAGADRIDAGRLVIKGEVVVMRSPADAIRSPAMSRSPVPHACRGGASSLPARKPISHTSGWAGCGSGAPAWVSRPAR
jgi:ribose transport system ATP-binding protein